MGDFEKHLSIAREKLSALKEAYQKRRYTVVGDLAIKVVEQLVEADAAKNNRHFGTHSDRHEYSNKNFPVDINKAIRKIGGQKLSAGCIIIPSNKKNIVEKFFRKYKIRCEAINIWK